MTITRHTHIQQHWRIVALAGFAVVLAALSYLGVSALLGSEEPVTLADSASAADTTGAPRIEIQTISTQRDVRQPTADECATMEKLLEASLPNLRKSHEDGARSAGVPQWQIDSDLQALERSAERSREWFADGCPANDKLGVVDRPGGKELLILDIMTIGSPLR